MPEENGVVSVELGRRLHVTDFLSFHGKLEEQLAGWAQRKQPQALQQASQCLVRRAADPQVRRVSHKHHRAFHLADEAQHEQQQVDEAGVVAATAHADDAVPKLQQRFDDARWGVQDLVDQHAERRACSVDTMREPHTLRQRQARPTTHSPSRFARSLGAMGISLTMGLP